MLLSFDYEAGKTKPQKLTFPTVSFQLISAFMFQSLKNLELRNSTM